MLKPGETFGRYEIVRHIGLGELGDVYEARDTRLGRRVALKVLRRVHDAEARARMLADARSAASIDHPNVATIFDFGEIDSTPFVAVELVAGQPAIAYAAEHDVAVEVRLGWLVSVARVLDVADACGVVHTAFRSGDVRIREDGELKVHDLGIARAISDPTPPSVPLTQCAWGRFARELFRGVAVPRHLEEAILRALGETDPPFPTMTALGDALENAPGAEEDSKEWSRVTEPIDAVRESVPSPSAPPVPPARKGTGTLMLLVVVTVCLFLGWAIRSSSARKTTVAPTPAGIPDSRATSTSAEANAAYAGALRSLQDVAPDAAFAELDRATAIDPGFAAAHLRRVLYAGPDLDVREHYAKAFALRGSLNPHDRALLEAFGPWISTPPDLGATEERLAALANSALGDVEVLYLLCKVRYFSGNAKSSIEACERAEQLDPTFAPAMRLRAAAEASLGDLPNAMDSYDRCLAHSPAAVYCLKEQFELVVLGSECEDALLLARRLIAIDPSAARYRELLAAELYATGAPIESVRTAVALAVERTPAARRTREEARMESTVDILEGRFGDAKRHLADEEAAIAKEPLDEVHADLARRRAWLAREMGDVDEAVRILDAYLARRSAWVAPMPMDRGFLAVATRYRLGAMSRGAFVTARTHWLEAQRSTSGRYAIPTALRWIFAYADVADTPADAVEALDARPAYGVIPAWAHSSNVDDAEGEVFLRTGALDDAISHFDHGARSCWAWGYPIDAVWARAHLAQALAAKGRTAEACAEYAKITGAWGEALSTSASRATVRMRELGCPLAR